MLDNNKRCGDTRMVKRSASFGCGFLVINFVGWVRPAGLTEIKHTALKGCKYGFMEAKSAKASINNKHTTWALMRHGQMFTSCNWNLFEQHDGKQSMHKHFAA